MKKLILTGFAAALFCIGAIAQVQDTASNNLRTGAQETEEEVQEAGNELQDRTEQTGDEMKEDTQEAGNELRQGAEETGDEIQQGAEQTGDEIEDETQEAGNELRQGAEETGNEIEQGAERTGDQMEQGAEEAKDELNEDGPSSENTQQDPNAMGTENSMGANAQPQHEIEVLEEKEGPNNQVVYKYQGELYYVDRDQKQLVQIEESQLKDAAHEAIVVSGVEEKDEN